MVSQCIMPTSLDNHESQAFNSLNQLDFCSLSLFGVDLSIQLREKLIRSLVILNSDRQWNSLTSSRGLIKRIICLALLHHQKIVLVLDQHLVNVILQVKRCFILLQHAILMRLLLHHSHVELRLQQASYVSGRLLAGVADVGQCKRLRLERLVCLAQFLFQCVHFMLETLDFGLQKFFGVNSCLGVVGSGFRQT